MSVPIYPSRSLSHLFFHLQQLPRLPNVSKDGPGHANTRAAAAQWVNATNAPRCATQVSDREKSFIAEAARVRLVLDVWQSVWRGLPALAAVPVCCCMQPACMLRLFRFLRVPALVLAVENRTKMLYKCSPHSTPFYDAETINQPTQPNHLVLTAVGLRVSIPCMLRGRPGRTVLRWKICGSCRSRLSETFKMQSS